MPKPERKLIDFSSAKEPPNSIDRDVDPPTENPNNDTPFDGQKVQEKRDPEMAPGEQMIQQTFLPGGS